MFNLNFAYSPWWLVLLGALAVALAWWAYRKPSALLPPRLLPVLRILRALGVFLLGLLLVQPLLTQLMQEEILPRVVVLVDNSQSMLQQQDSTWVKQELPTRLQELDADLRQQQLEVDFYRFGIGNQPYQAGDSLDFREPGTNLGQALQDIRLRYERTNLAAVVPLTDGIATRGQSPAYLQDAVAAPVFPLYTGDTAQRLDLRIAGLRYNQLGYVDTKAPIEADVESRAWRGGPAQVNLLQDGQVLEQQTVQLAAGQDRAPVRFTQTLDAPGVRTYTLAIKPVAGEFNTRNNSRRLQFEVLEKKTRLLLLAGAPHPDLAALQRAFGSDPRFTVQSRITTPQGGYMGQTAPPDLGEADVVLLHNFPAREQDRPLLRKLQAELERRPLALWTITGANTQLALLGALTPYLPAKPTQASSGVSEAQLVLAEGYELHATARAVPTLADWAPTAPPLWRPNVRWTLQAGAELAARSAIRNVELDYPLLAHREQNGRKSLLMTGDGWWRLRMQHYQQQGDFEAFDRWMQQWARWLSTRSNRQRFRLYPAQQRFSPREPVVLQAEVYDETYAPLAGAQVRLELLGPNDLQQEHQLNPVREGFYELRLRDLPGGDYTFRGEARLGEQQIGQVNGRFQVGASQEEFAELQAQVEELGALARKTGGELLPARQLEQLPELLSQREFPTTLRNRRELFPLTESLILLGLILLVFGLEWVLRRIYGEI